MPDERAAIDRAGQYWDAVVLDGDGPAVDLDPALALAIHRLHDLAAVPSSSARERVWATVMANAAKPHPMEEGATTRALALGPLAFPQRLGGPGSREEGSRHFPLWMMAQLATAALLVITLIGSYVAFGPGRSRRPEAPVVIPAIVANPAELLWQNKGGPDLPLGLPGPLALDPAGNLWVTDSANDRFQIFSPDGAFLEAWGESGAGAGQFRFERNLFPGGAIAFAPDGGFYVVDTGNLRIQRFAPDRSFLAAWGGDGAGDGQFKWPSGIAIDGQGRVYVTDDQRNDVQVFAADGAYLRTIGEYGFGDGQFFFSTGSSVYVDAAGTIWVSDGSNQRIQTFSPDGELLAVLPGGAGKERLGKPAQIAIDAAGRVFVAAPDLRQVQVFAPDGFHLASWGDPGPAAWAEANLPPGTFLTPVGLVLDGQGNVYVSDMEGERVQKFRLLPPFAPEEGANPSALSEGAAEFVWESKGGQNAPLSYPGALAIDPDGNLWVPDTGNNRFQILSPDGRVVDVWGTKGDGHGQFDFMGEGGATGGGIAFDNAGNFYVVEPANRRVQKFAPDRSFLLAGGGEGDGEGQFLWPATIAVDGEGNVYVADAERDDIQVFDGSGTYLRTIGGFGLGEGQFYFFCGSGMAFDREGNLLVSDACNHRVQIFSRDGTFLRSLGGYGKGAGKLDYPLQIAVDAAGRIYVAENGNHRVQVFAPDGAALVAWGTFGTQPGEFVGASAVALDGQGNVYVGDLEEDRVQKYRLQPPLVPTAGQPGAERHVAFVASTDGRARASPA